MTTTILNVYKRPVVVFNPKNIDHRHYVMQFYRKKTWGKCPVTFHCPPNTDVVTHTSAELLKFYMLRESTKKCV